MAYRKRIENYLDAGHGACWLAHPEIAQIFQADLLYYENQRYRLHAWVIMPNHVHLLLVTIEPFSLSMIIKDLKSITARKINHYLKRTGKVWQEEYWDRYIRDEAHYNNAVSYIRENPVKARLVKQSGEWPWVGYREISSSND